MSTWTAPDKDTDEALRWFLLAAEQGIAEAQAELAFHYEYREGDLPLAITWYRRAAEGGDGYAQYELALIYEEGKGRRYGQSGGRAPLSPSGGSGDQQGSDSSSISSTPWAQP